MKTVPAEAVAVVGMGIAVPGASSPEEYWRVLNQNEPRFGPPGERWDERTLVSRDRGAEDRVYRREMGYITDFRACAEAYRDLPPSLDPEIGLWLRHCLVQATAPLRRDPADRWLMTVAASPDASQRLEEALIVDGAAAVLARGTGTAEQVRRELRALYPGSSGEPADYLPPRQAALAASGVLPEHTQISILQGACSGGLHAIDAGVRALLADECDVAVCGSSFVLNRMTNVLCSVMRAAAGPDGLLPFDRRATGTVFAEGAGVIALKPHRRALDDGDRVLGLILGTATSVDGPGLSIVTPNPDGQRLAVTRALERANLAPRDLQWVIAHGTGTRAGDAAELRMLSQLCVDGARWRVTSNKALIGHTGWTAGIASVVNALLALEHDRIPAQRGFDEPSDPESLASGALRIPRQDVVWSGDADGAARVAAVCAYGLGGSNGCVLVGQGGPIPRRASPPAAPDDVVVVGWHTLLPTAPDRSRVKEWLASGVSDWPDAFPDPFPTLAADACALAPGVQRSLDRAHSALLACAHALVRDLGTTWRGVATDTGVFVGHMGPTRVCSDYALRAGLDDLAVRAGEGLLPGPLGWTAEQLARQVRLDVPRGISDTYTGMLGCIMASRVCVQHDLHGLAQGHEAGSDSLLAALDAARRQLRSDGVQLALVFGVAANAERGDALLGSSRGERLREGVFAFALARRGTARRLSLPVLARIEKDGSGCGGDDGRPPGLRGFLGADSAVRLLRALIGLERRTRIRPEQDPHTPGVVLEPVSSPPGSSPPGSSLLADPLSSTETSGRWTLALTRDLVTLTAQHLVGGRPTMPATILLESAAQAAARLVPGLLPRMFENAVFSSFIRTEPTGRAHAPVTVNARILEHARNRAVVEVAVVSDVSLPDGRVLHADRERMSVRVHMADHIPQRPYYDEFRTPSEDTPFVPDVYCPADGPDRLSGVFDCLRGLRAFEPGGCAHWLPRAEPDHPVLSGFRTPVLLLDALLRTCQLRGELGGASEPAVPIALQRLSLYTLANDLTVAGLFGTGITLHHLHPDGPEGRRRQVACAPDGTILAEVHGLRVSPRPSRDAASAGGTR